MIDKIRNDEVLRRIGEERRKRKHDEKGKWVKYEIGPVSYTHLDVYKRQV